MTIVCTGHNGHMLSKIHLWIHNNSFHKFHSGAQATHRNVAMDLPFSLVTALAVRKLQTVVKHSFKLTITTTKSRSDNFSRTIAKKFRYCIVIGVW